MIKIKDSEKDVGELDYAGKVLSFTASKGVLESTLPRASFFSFSLKGQPKRGHREHLHELNSFLGCAL